VRYVTTLEGRKEGRTQSHRTGPAAATRTRSHAGTTTINQSRGTEHGRRRPSRRLLLQKLARGICRHQEPSPELLSPAQWLSKARLYVHGKQVWSASSRRKQRGANGWGDFFLEQQNRANHGRSTTAASWGGVKTRLGKEASAAGRSFPRPPPSGADFAAQGAYEEGCVVQPGRVPVRFFEAAGRRPRRSQPPPTTPRHPSPPRATPEIIMDTD
jgi:hypothetical protein